MTTKNIDKYRETPKVFRLVSYIPLHIVKFLKEIDVLFLFRRTVIEYYFRTFGYIGSVITIEKKFVTCEKNKDFIVQTRILNPDPRFRVTSRTHVPGSHGVLLFLDKQSLQEKDKYYEIISRFMKLYKGQKFPVILTFLDDMITPENVRRFNSMISILKKSVTANSTQKLVFFEKVLEKSQSHMKKQVLSFISRAYCSMMHN